LSDAFGLNHTTFYVDGAHTPESSEACIAWFNETTKDDATSTATNDVRRVNVLVFNCFTNRDPKVLLHSHVNSGHFDYGFFTPVVRAQTTSTAMEKLTTIPANTSWQQHVRSVWLELQKEKKAGATNEENALVLSSLEATMEKLKSLEEDLVSSNKHQSIEIRVLVTGSIHLVGGVLGLMSERGVPDLL